MSISSLKSIQNKLKLATKRFEMGHEVAKQALQEAIEHYPGTRDLVPINQAYGVLCLFQPSSITVWDGIIKACEIEKSPYRVVFDKRTKTFSHERREKSWVKP